MIAAPKLKCERLGSSTVIGSGLHAVLSTLSLCILYCLSITCLPNHNPTMLELCVKQRP